MSILDTYKNMCDSAVLLSYELYYSPTLVQLLQARSWDSILGRISLVQSHACSIRLNGSAEPVAVEHLCIELCILLQYGQQVLLRWLEHYNGVQLLYD